MNQTFDTGGLIFSEGEPGDCAYIIERGNVELSILVNGIPTQISKLQPGALFGEMALLGNHLRTATAVAGDDTELIVIPGKYFSERLDNTDKFISLLLKILLQRYLEMRTRLDTILHQSEPGIPVLIHDNTWQECELGTEYAARQLEAENNLRAAFDSGQLELFYQPIVALDDGETVGCEALLRWRHPQRGIVPPVEFIPLAEESGLIIPIGFWIIEQAVNACLDFVERGKHFKFVSINLSGKQFLPGDLVENITEIFQNRKLHPDKVKFEITESILMANPLYTASSLAALKQCGSSIAIDDFGTGYSSFSYLHRFPIDTLKIDRSFVSTMMSNAKSYEIVKSLVMLAKSIGMSIVAEGVETAEEHQMLKVLGADYGQGYYYAKPMPEADFHSFLNNEPK